MDEFLDLHYGPAAPPIRRFINMYHDRVAAKGIHQGCSGRADHYGIDESVAKAAVNAFAEALGLADSDAVKARVEKASICAYAAAIGMAWEQPDGKLLDPAATRTMRPVVKRLFELCAKYQVPMISEHMTIDAARQMLRTKLGLKAGEDF
jgi:hypothetical protein